MEKVIDRMNVLRGVDVNSLGRSYLTQVSYMPPPTSQHALLFLKQLVAEAHRSFSAEGDEMTQQDCLALAGVLQASPAWDQALALLYPTHPQLALPQEVGRFLGELLWESMLTNDEGYILEDAAFVDVSNSFFVPNPQAYFARLEVDISRRAGAAAAAGCPADIIEKTRDASGTWLERAYQTFMDAEQFEGFFKWQAHFMANRLVESEAEVFSRTEEIKKALREHLFRLYRPGMQCVADFTLSSADSLFDHCFEVWMNWVRAYYRPGNS